MITISRLYDDYDAAARTVADLERGGIAHSDISIVASNADGWYDRDGSSTTMRRVDRDHDRVVDPNHDRDRDGVDDRLEGARTGAGIGTAIGGTAGLLAGLGLLAIPGLGPVVAAGWLASLAVVAVAGGATGGIIGALTQAGVSEDDAHVYAEGVRRGGILVTARVPDADRTRYEAILDRSAINLRDRALTWERSGWNRFDPNAPPYTAEEIRRERENYRTRA
jgi:hypothetical protein